MSKAIFLFHGANYKRGTDSGRFRVPLDYVEAEQVFYDTELPGDTDNSIGTELNMQKYARAFCDLAVGDEIFLGIAPDAAYYRHLWIHSFNKVPGFKVELDLVSVKDVYTAFLAGDATGVPAFNPTPLEYDFVDGQIQATKDSVLLSKLYNKPRDEYRSDLALQGQVITPEGTLAQLGESLYFRITIVELGTLGDGSDGECCSSCGENVFPSFQVGAVYDRLCVKKQRVAKTCNCNVNLCGPDCGGDLPPATDVPNVEPVVLPVVEPVAAVTVDEGTAITDIQLVSDAVGEVVWSAAPLPAGLTLDTATGVISGTPTEIGVVAVIVTVTDAEGNASDPVSFVLTVTAI